MEVEMVDRSSGCTGDDAVDLYTEHFRDNGDERALGVDDVEVLPDAGRRFSRPHM